MVSKSGHSDPGEAPGDLGTLLCPSQKSPVTPIACSKQQPLTAWWALRLPGAWPLDQAGARDRWALGPTGWCRATRSSQRT